VRQAAREAFAYQCWLPIAVSFYHMIINTTQKRTTTTTKKFYKNYKQAKTKIETSKHADTERGKKIKYKIIK